MCRQDGSFWWWGVHVGCFIHVPLYVRWTETGSKEERDWGDIPIPTGCEEFEQIPGTGMPK